MKRIVLLDDSPTIQRVVTLSFASAKGYDVKAASNVSTAQSLLADGTPDVLIGYVRFTGEMSPEFFSSLGVPIDQILLLAESKENLDAFEAAGFNQIVRKPFHTDELKRAILSIIGEDSIRVEDSNTPSLNKAPPPPPSFRPTTTISMEALDKAFHKAEAGSSPASPVISPPPPPPPVVSTVVPPPPPRTTTETSFLAPDSLPPPPPIPNLSSSDETSIRRTVPPPPPPIRRRESHISPLVSHASRTQVKQPPAQPPPLSTAPAVAVTMEDSGAQFDLLNGVHSKQKAEPEKDLVQPAPQPPSVQEKRKADAPSIAVNLAHATFANAEARNEIKEWIERELPKIARDLVREELQKLLNK